MRYNKFGDKMQKQKRLLFARNVFLFIIFVCFGVIIVTEKSAGLLIPKVEKKMQEYLNTIYSELKDSIKLGKVTYDRTIYKMKVTSVKNKNHYFYIYYNNKKMTDTYKKDYSEGGQLLKTIQKDLEQDIRKKTSTSVKVSIISTLDKYTSLVQDKIITEDNLLELKFYNIEKDLTIKDWTSKEILTSISELVTKCQNNNITPKSYTFTITNSKDITQSIQISNITEEFINSKDNEQIINDILEDNNSKLVKNNKIKYKYLNEEE